MKAILFTVLCFTSMVSNAMVWYVNAAASGLNTGTSWANACTDIASAISNSSSGDEIWVAAATYKPSTSVSSVYYNLKAGVSLYGGFNGTETALAQRNLQVNTTIISGDIGILGYPDDNTYHLFKATNLSVLSVVDGFVIKDAVAYAIGITHTYGYYGAAAWITNSQVKFANCSFATNLARGGAAIYATSSTISIEQCKFNGNTANADNGGAIYTQNTNMTISQCNFLSNSATAGAGTADGGAIYISNLTSGAVVVNITLDRCVFSNNSTLHMGSAIKAFNYKGSISMSNCLLVGNFSRYGSVIELLANVTAPVTTSYAIIRNCTIAYNAADTSLLTFHPIQLVATYKQVENSILWKNTATTQLDTSYQVKHCIVDGGYSTGVQVLNMNPYFSNPPVFNNLAFLGNNSDYTLQVLSPGIDAGDNALVNTTMDINDSARIQNVAVDLGCFENAYCTMPLVVNVSPNDTLCNGQSALLSASAGQGFLWSNGSTAASLPVNLAGTYSLIAIDTITHCRGKAERLIVILPPNIQTVQAYVCSGGSVVLPDGTMLTNIISNVVDTTMLLSSFGCDSMVITQINVLPSYSINALDMVCPGASYTYPDGYTITNIVTSVSHSSHLATNNFGCDSIINTTISLHPVYNLTRNDTICLGNNFTFPDGTIINNVNADTAHANFLTSTWGCDSTVITHLHVHTIDTSIVQTGPLLSSNATGVNYQWIDCDTQLPLPGATNQSYTAIANGNYAVRVSDNWCTDTSGCRQVKGLATSQFDQTKLLIYPNPVLDQLIIDCSGNNSGGYEIRLTDLIGQTIMKMTNPKSFGQVTLPLRELQPGCYLLHVETKDGKLEVRKIVKR